MTIHDMRHWNGDLAVENWKVLVLPNRLDGAPGVERHIFGFSPETQEFQLSSEILEETEEYIRTRSRRYFKIGPASQSWERDELDQCIQFLETWRIPKPDISVAVAPWVH